LNIGTWIPTQRDGVGYIRRLLLIRRRMTMKLDQAM